MIYIFFRGFLSFNLCCLSLGLRILPLVSIGGCIGFVGMCLLCLFIIIQVSQRHSLFCSFRWPQHSSFLLCNFFVVTILRNLYHHPLFNFVSIFCCLLSILPPFELFYLCTGHHIYEGLRVIRLEFLIKQNYPELVAEIKESEGWIEDQCSSNPYYAGPVNVS